MKKFVLFLIIFSCTSDISTPDGALKDFVEARFNKNLSKDFILSRVTGKMRQSFENMTEDDFEKFSNIDYLRRDSFKILSKSCQEKRCFITYILKYTTSQDDRDAFKTEVKKIAELSWYEGQWYIADVVNMKTYHDSLEPLEPLEVVGEPSN